MISVRSLSKSFGSHAVLRGVSLDIEIGETVVIFGPSGSGKTTLLRCIDGLEWGNEGSIAVDGIHLDFSRPSNVQLRELREIRLRCGFVFQQFHLFPHLTVLHNLLLAPTRVKNLSRLAAEEIATNLLNQVGLENKATQRPGTLSGGEQQRVAIARALAMQPAYLLYDEPTSSLDRDRAREIWKIMRNLAQGGQTQIIVTHQEELVKEVPCRVLGMRDGKIEQIST